jgi:hypothetical protein
MQERENRRLRCYPKAARLRDQACRVSPTRPRAGPCLSGACSTSGRNQGRQGSRGGETQLLIE